MLQLRVMAERDVLRAGLRVVERAFVPRVRPSSVVPGLGAPRLEGVLCTGGAVIALWDDAGAYVRFSVTFVAKDEADEQRVLGEIDKRLAGSGFEF